MEPIFFNKEFAIIWNTESKVIITSSDKHTPTTKFWTTQSFYEADTIGEIVNKVTELSLTPDPDIVDEIVSRAEDTQYGLEASLININTTRSNVEYVGFTMSAHSSLTASDIGKFVMRWDDPEFISYFIDDGATPSDENVKWPLEWPSSFAGSYDTVRLPMLSGGASGSAGVWEYDYNKDYDGVTFETLSKDNHVIRVNAYSHPVSVYKRNMFFHADDPYLSSIIGSMSYTDFNTSGVTYSVVNDDSSFNIQFVHYCNNGFPVSDYEANSSNNGSPSQSHHISSTVSVFTSAIITGGVVNMTIDPNEAVGGWTGSDPDVDRLESFPMTFNGSGNVVTPLVIPKVEILDMLQFPIVGILDSLSGGVARILDIPDTFSGPADSGMGTTIFIITLPTTRRTAANPAQALVSAFPGLALGYQTGNATGSIPLIDVVVEKTPPGDPRAFYKVYEPGHYWGVGMSGVLTNLPTEDIFNTYQPNSPIYIPLTSGVVGDIIRWRREPKPVWTLVDNSDPL